MQGGKLSAVTSGASFRFVIVVGNAVKERREACGTSLFYGVDDNLVQMKLSYIPGGRLLGDASRGNPSGMVSQIGREWWRHMKYGSSPSLTTIREQVFKDSANISLKLQPMSDCWTATNLFRLVFITD